MKARSYFFFALFLVISFSLEAQIESVFVEKAPVIDGELENDIWTEVSALSGFKTFVPDFSQKMPYRTEAYVAHDAENLYFALKCYDDPDEIKTSIAARDKIRDDDWICINLDSFNGGQSLYGFYINPNGIQMDTRFAAGDEDIGLDLIWYSAGKIVEDGYIVEARIPFKSIRYASKDGEVEMGVIFERKISRFSMQGTFPALDPGQGFNFVNQTMPLHYSGVKKSQLIELLPAITYGRSSEHREGAYYNEGNFEPSLTAKIGLTSELVLDATINPDFSQVESDASQVETNQRFAINYPERRPFFLEGNENFNFAGNSFFSPVQQIVNTRTIVSPKAATKLTGKIGKRNILSTIYAADRVDENLTDFAQDETADVGVFRYMRSLSQDSYVGLIGTGRWRNGAMNAVYGFDGQYRFNNANQISGHFLNSLTKTEAGAPTVNKGTASLNISRNTRNFDGFLNFLDIAEGFRSDVGFVTRTGISKVTLNVSPKLFPKKGLVKRIDTQAYLSLTKDKPSGKNESTAYFSLAATLPRNTRFSVGVDISTEIYQAQRFDDGGLTLNASSQITKRIFFRTSYGWDRGVFYSTPAQGYGKRINSLLILQASDKLNVEVSHRFQSLYNDVTDEKYFDTHIFRGRVTYQMNKYLFFRAIAQYRSLSKELAPNILASFTYIPGTVLHLGYGSILERTRWDGTAYVEDNQFLRRASGLFFKASYLWRL